EGWPGKRVMTLTWVSVGSGKASTVRPRKAWNPASAAMMVKRTTAARFLSAMLRMPSSTAVLLTGQVEGVEQEQRPAGHVALAVLEPRGDLRLVVAHPAHLDLAPL